MSQLPPRPAHIHFRSSPIRNPFRHWRLRRTYKSPRPKDVISQIHTERKCVIPRPATSAHFTNKILLTPPALRLYPSVPINVRIARKTSYLPRGGGSNGEDPVLVPRNVGVGIVPYYLHRRKDLYGDDAHEFRPERWEGPELANIGWGYMPFHGGPRLCLGSEFQVLKAPRCDGSYLVNSSSEDFALMEASCAVVRIIQRFPNIRLPPNHPVVPTGQEKQTLTIFLSSTDGCKVLLE